MPSTDNQRLHRRFCQPEGLPEGSRGLSEATPPELVSDSKHPERVPETRNPFFCDPFRVVMVSRAKPGVSADAPTPGYLLTSLRLVKTRIICQRHNPKFIRKKYEIRLENS